jgi:hypothetical protein
VQELDNYIVSATTVLLIMFCAARKPEVGFRSAHPRYAHAGIFVIDSGNNHSFSLISHCGLFELYLLLVCQLCICIVFF